jgi:hypothetical protein
LTASCAPAAVPTAPPLVEEPAPVPTATVSTYTSVPEAAVSTPTQTMEVQAVPTSRGPKLEATDPATVNLASGQVQLVEFFRFT